MNYVTAQFYGCAIHPTALSHLITLVAHRITGRTSVYQQQSFRIPVEATGGDGAFCNIDQNQPQYQFTQYVFNEYYRSTDGGGSWTSILHRPVEDLSIRLITMMSTTGCTQPE